MKKLTISALFNGLIITSFLLGIIMLNNFCTTKPVKPKPTVKESLTVQKEVKKRPPKPKKAAPLKASDEYADFIKAHFISYLVNECIPNKPCCSTLVGDKGGYTCYGVAVNSNNSFFRAINATGASQKSLILKKAASVLIFQKYFKDPRIDMLPFYMRQIVFDYAVHSGPRQAIRTLQKQLSLPADGIIGPHTLKKAYAISAEGRVSFIRRYIDNRWALLKSLKIYGKYKVGFDNRIKRQRNQLAHSLRYYRSQNENM